MLARSRFWLCLLNSGKEGSHVRDPEPKGKPAKHPPAPVPLFFTTPREGKRTTGNALATTFKRST